MLLRALLAGLLLAAVIAGAEPPAPPGRLVNLGGYRLHLYCTGKGSPVVVLSAGAGDFSTDWALVQSKVASFTRVCSYDRGGAAWSDLGPKPRTLDQEAFDLRRLLVAAEERGPYVLVGHSMGGMVMRLFDANNVRRVVGMVLVDAYSEDEQLFLNGEMHRARLMTKDRPIPAPRSRVTASDRLTNAELRDINDFIKQFKSNPDIGSPYNKLPPYAQQARIWALKQPEYYAQDDDYLPEISARVFAETQSVAHPLGDLPLIVLTRSKYDYPPPHEALLEKEHKDQQARMTQLSTRGKQITVPNVGHHIHIEAPDAVVAAIKELIGARP